MFNIHHFKTKIGTNNRFTKIAEKIGGNRFRNNTQIRRFNKPLLPAFAGRLKLSIFKANTSL